MKFNTQLKEGLKHYEKTMADQNIPEPAATDKNQKDSKLRNQTTEKVVGGDIRWKPVNRAAAMLLAKAPWWAHPPKISTPIKQTENKKQLKPKKEQKNMVKHSSTLGGGNVVGSDSLKKWVVFGDYAMEVKGICKKTGEPLLDQIDMWPILLDQMNKMKHELTPPALAMIDGEKALREATKTAKECMEEMRSSSKIFLDEIRQTKYATLAETSALVAPLKEVRQFFLGSDYEKQMVRLNDFVNLCERLQKLKDSGFLDSVADTMLRLAERESE